jgi:hypothetical protein
MLAEVLSAVRGWLLRPSADEGKPRMPAHCVHRYYYSWAGRCEGCHLTPLSPNLPDPRIRGLASADD